MLVTMAVAAIPIASADTCTLVVALPTGGTTTITVNAAPGTPPASLVPPGDTLVSANCTPSTSTSTTPTATVTTSTTTTPTGTTGPTSTTSSTTPTTSTT